MTRSRTVTVTPSSSCTRRDVFGVEPDPAAARRRVPDDDRLEQRLREVAVLRRAGHRVVGLAGGMRAPGADAADLVAGQAGAEDRVAHQLVRRRLGPDVRLDAEVAEDLDGALVGDVRPRGVRRPPVLGDDHVVDAVGGQAQRGAAAGRAAADDQDVGLEVLVLGHGAFSRRMSKWTPVHGVSSARPSGAVPGGCSANVDDEAVLDPEHRVGGQVGVAGDEDVRGQGPVDPAPRP